MLGIGRALLGMRTPPANLGVFAVVVVIGGYLFGGGGAAGALGAGRTLLQGILTPLPVCGLGDGFFPIVTTSWVLGGGGAVGALA